MPIIFAIAQNRENTDDCHPILINTGQIIMAKGYLDCDNCTLVKLSDGSSVVIRGSLHELWQDCKDAN